MKVISHFHNEGEHTALHAYIGGISIHTSNTKPATANLNTSSPQPVLVGNHSVLCSPQRKQQDEPIARN